MGVIHLMHPRHGFKIATMEMEAQYDEQHGWMRYEPEDLEALPEDAEPANVLTEPRRRGRARAEKSE